MIKTIKYFFQSVIIYLFFFIGKILGLTLSRIFFSTLFTFMGPIFKSKETINSNLKFFSKNISNSQMKEISKEMWGNYGMTFIEYIFLNYFKKNNSHINIIGEENLTQVLENKKPVIFISGHFANYELMSMEITKKNINLATIYRPLNNIFLNPFMEYLRKKYVCKHQIKKGIKGVKDAINFIKKRHSIALMIDQRVSEGEMVDLFGKPALTTTLPAQLAIKFQLTIIPVFIERVTNSKFNIEFKKEINVNRFKDKLELTKELNLTLEKMIAKNPNQWIWTHNRWK
jgi:Kdo2-lipid IVA lauroyltransferase/acyltransferase